MLQRRYISVVMLAVAAALGVLFWRAEHAYTQDRLTVDFNRDIRPILNRNCISCHGGVKQQGNVSFIYREEALGSGKSGHPTVVPGSPNSSELIARVTSSDPDTRMPYRAPPLQPHEIALLKQWIREGAHWENYWAFVAPESQPLPPVKHTAWARQPFDQFVLSRLESEGLTPSAEASKTELLRRVYLDLIGLPPTPEELKDFLADSSPNAYEKQVDRLLSSAHYGERWASLWLDLSRYADSKGFDVDRNHTVWPYRDWLIDALNRNVHYDKFMITQLAGDLLPNATMDDHIATTFHRLTQTNDEGGTDDEEFRIVAVMDRVSTTWSVLNGLTMNCVQCHSHPYDPIRHRDFYASMAFFNNSRDCDYFDEAPLLRVPLDRKRFSEALQLQQTIQSVSREVVESGRSMVQRSSWISVPIIEASVNRALGLERYLDDLRRGAPPMGEEAVSFANQGELRKFRFMEMRESRDQLSKERVERSIVAALKVRGGEIDVEGTIPEQAVIQLRTRPPTGMVTALRLEVSPKEPQKARHTPEAGFIVDHIDAWLTHSDGHREKIAFRHFTPDSESDLQTQVMRAQFARSGLPPGQPYSNAFSKSDGFAAYTKLARTHWVVAIPLAPIRVDSQTSIEVNLTQTQVIAKKPATIPRLRIYLSRDDRWTDYSKDPRLTEDLTRLLEADRLLAAIDTVGVPVMAEQPEYERRPTLEFERGNFLSKVGPDLMPGVPAIFPSQPEGEWDRLALARWFFQPKQPLTARVAVNRYWEQLFGIGLVETLENFGSAGDLPSHPELLDWLAVHFQRDLRWDVKALLRELVTSATYRQTAKATPQLKSLDPRNRMLARGPQQRLTAEMVRDQALLASGLLSSRMFGPPVMPPQPPGIWMNVANSSKWINSTGQDRYRRAVYTYLKRTASYPSFLTFDAVAHDVSVARRIPTNTPLQALVTMNDPVYYEAAQALARHWIRDVLSSGDGHRDALDARLDDGAQRVLSRGLEAEEREALRNLYEEVLRGGGLEDSADAAAQDVSRHREARISSEIETRRMTTALTAVATVLLNLDAAMTR